MGIFVLPSLWDWMDRPFAIVDIVRSFFIDRYGTLKAENAIKLLPLYQTGHDLMELAPDEE
jgi:hypothetical protein